MTWQCSAIADLCGLKNGGGTDTIPVTIGFVARVFGAGVSSPPRIFAFPAGGGSCCEGPMCRSLNLSKTVKQLLIRQDRSLRFGIRLSTRIFTTARLWSVMRWQAHHKSPPCQPTRCCTENLSHHIACPFCLRSVSERGSEASLVHGQNLFVFEVLAQLAITPVGQVGCSVHKEEFSGCVLCMLLWWSGIQKSIHLGIHSSDLHKTPPHNTTSRVNPEPPTG